MIFVDDLVLSCNFLLKKLSSMNFEKVKFDFMNNQETLQETFTL